MGEAEEEEGLNSIEDQNNMRGRGESAMGHAEAVGGQNEEMDEEDDEFADDEEYEYGEDDMEGENIIEGEEGEEIGDDAQDNDFNKGNVNFQQNERDLGR